MTTRTARWGVLLLVLAVLLTAAIGAVSVAIGPHPSDTLLTVILPGIALIVGITTLFAGHVSYPRVQNLRVYVAGYATGLLSIVFALVVGFAPRFANSVPAVPLGFAQLMLAIAVVGAYAYTLLPAFPTYRATRAITWTTVGLLLAGLLVVRFLPEVFAGIDVLAGSVVVSIPSAAIAALTLGVIVINAVLPAQSFYLRGAFAGLAFLAGGSWFVAPAVTALGYDPVSAPVVQLLYFIIAPVFLIGAILIHVLARMEHRVSYDPLLQIYNREYCNSILSEQSSISTRPPFGVMMIDIDHFKLVNDRHGHQAGDRILFTVAQAVQKLVVPEGIVCRYGGEELIVFLPGLSGRDVVPMAQRLRQHMESTETQWRRHRIGVTISIGLSDRKNTRQPLTHVVRAADKALYIAKENGRNQVRFVRLK